MALAPEDAFAIQKLMADYNHAVDQLEGDTFAALFVESGSLQRGEEVTTGRAELSAFASALPNGIRHVVSNVSIDGEDTRATARAYLQVWSTPAMAGEARMLVSGIYADVLERSDDGWLFVSRVLTYDA
jgi:hypothetical protein